MGQSADLQSDPAKHVDPKELKRRRSAQVINSLLKPFFQFSFSFFFLFLREKSSLLSLSVQFSVAHYCHCRRRHHRTPMSVRCKKRHQTEACDVSFLDQASLLSKSKLRFINLGLKFRKKISLLFVFLGF